MIIFRKQESEARISRLRELLSSSARLTAEELGKRDDTITDLKDTLQSLKLK